MTEDQKLSTNTEQRKKRSIEEIKERQKSDSEGFIENMKKLNEKYKDSSIAN